MRKTKLRMNVSPTETSLLLKYFPEKIPLSFVFSPCAKRVFPIKMRCETIRSNVLEVFSCIYIMITWEFFPRIRFVETESEWWVRRKRGEKKNDCCLKQAIQMNSINIITQLFVSTAHYLANQQIMSLFLLCAPHLAVYSSR